MKCKYSITIWLFLAVLLLVACDSGEQQRLQLAELERQNRADSLMLNDSLARDLALWFDRHGTRNEQMRAHYILGRTSQGDRPPVSNKLGNNRPDVQFNDENGIHHNVEFDNSPKQSAKHKETIENNDPNSVNDFFLLLNSKQK